MVKFRFIIAFLAMLGMALSLSALSPAVAAVGDTQIKVATDRTKLMAGLSFNLIIDVHTPLKFKGSDLNSKELAANFTIGNITYENLSSGNKHLFRWTLPLIPKTSGIIKVPALPLGTKFKTPRFELRVAPQQNINNTRLVKVELRNKKLIAGQLAMYRMEVELLPGIKIETITPPSSPDATITRFAERTISRARNGKFRKTLIHEYKVIFNKPGRKVISSPVVQGYITTQGNKSFMQRARDIPVEIGQAPANTIVSDNLTMVTEWEPKDTAIEVGQPVVRTITIRGTNNAISQLPEIKLPEIEGFDIYDNSSVDTEKLMRNKQLISTRTIKQVFVPRRNHTVLELPEEKFYWVNPNDMSSHEVKVTSGTYTIDGFSFNDYIPRNPKYTKPIIAGIICFILLSTFLYYSIIWYRRRVGIYGKLHHYNDKVNFWTQLKKNWSNTKPIEARTAILTWAKNRWPELRIIGLNNLPFYDAIKPEIDAMSNACWGGDNNWNGKTLLKKLCKYRLWEIPKPKEGLNPYDYEFSSKDSKKDAEKSK